MDDLKSLTTNLANLLKYKDVLIPLGVKELSGSELTKAYSDGISVRQSARLQVVCRSAALIVQKSRASDIQALDAQATSLKVTLPKPLRSKLDSMK